MADKPQMTDASIDAARNAPAAERNTDVILEVLRGQLPSSGRALEVASGTGQHAAAFARNFPGIDWIPSDPSAESRDSIAAWVGNTDLGNLELPLDIDVTKEHWPKAAEGPFDILLAINLVHISPWAACRGLLRGAGELLRGQGMLFLYGPYKRDGEHTADSNARFEEWLHGQDPEWGLRDIGEVECEAKSHGLSLDGIIDMPANNFSLILRKT